jgi:glycosyltransferase involved in cell wall biosynthesis
MIQGPPEALDVLALAPITDEAARAGDVFARRHPELALTRFSVSHFHLGPITPASEAYRRREEEEVHRRVWALATSILDGFEAAGAVVSPGRHLAEIVRARGIDPVIVVPTAIDLGQFAPQPKDGRLLRDLGIPPGAVVIAHVSNLKPVKRPLDLVRSAVEAFRRDERLIYLVAGDGPLVTSRCPPCFQVFGFR